MMGPSGRGNGVYVSKKMQEALGVLEEWPKAWGFRFSVAKTKSMLFLGKRIGGERECLYGLKALSLI